MEILNDIASKIGFDWRLAITNLFNFLIIFFLLVKFALPAIKKTVAERTEKIKEGLRMRDEADKIIDSAKQVSKEIAIEANKKAENIISKTDISAKEILSQANTKATEIVQLASKEKEEAKQKGLNEAENILTKDISKILTKISLNAFSSKITPEVNNEFITKTFKENFSSKI